MNADVGLINAWLAAPTWDESASFLREHLAELRTASVRQALAKRRDDETSRRHLAILYLVDAIPVEEAYQIVSDLSVATERALDLVESGDTGQLSLVMAANPGITHQGMAAAFLQVVIALARQDGDAADRFAELIAKRGSPSQREALAIRLRAFARHQADPALALAVADIIWAPV